MFHIASELKVPHPAWSEGIGLALIHLLQAYWKKSVHGSRDLSTWSILKCSTSGIALDDGAVVWANVAAQRASRAVKRTKKRIVLPTRARWPVNRRARGEI